ncbi:type II secretion system minor pseudopilin GspH [Gallaecimonas kandeliae]|uniref:type II secretion system minor pseudopilin GspH n=1 Tax=Gallaecimonas kandeliae TaxID=3029055 RepID=UPI00264A22F6|nr:type II secretion system minor pseudopilin GspH [Gallaecimonas kandeliae]WKE65918.1 type II secretion system minor pseudopilin GspH [Gallaecimonas kandeliae]
MKRRALGFTLLEILVVLFIVGMMVAMVSLSFGGPSDGSRLENEAQKWQARFALMHDEAIMRGEELGLKFKEDGGVEVMRFDPDAPAPGAEDDPDGPKGAWVALDDDGVLKNWQGAQGIHGTLRLEGLSLGQSLIPEDAFKAEDETKDNKKRLTPHLFFLSSGEFLPFELCLYKVKSSALDTLGGDDTRVLAGNNPDLVLETCIQGHANGSLDRAENPDLAWRQGELRW